MKTYVIEISGRGSKQYIVGRISGIIYALTGMPETEYVLGTDGNLIVLKFDATGEQCEIVHKCLRRLYPKIYLGYRQVG